MAYGTTVLMEIRSTGSNNNGGIYNTATGSTDYTQQDAAQVSVTDIVTDGAGTGISSATGGFTGMIGNGLHITDGTTPGIYEITAVADDNNLTIDRSAGASQSGLTGNIGGALAGFIDSYLEQLEAGNTVWLYDDVSLTETINLSQAGSTLYNIHFRGYNVTRGDNPTGTDRPTITCGAYYISLGNWYDIAHIYMTGTGSYVLLTKNRNATYNMKIENTSVTAGRYGLYIDAASGSTTYDCELISTNGYAIRPSGNSPHIIAGCYVHDSNYGIYSTNEMCVINSIIDTCTTAGIYASTAHIHNNTIYNCDDGIEFSAGTYIMRSIIGNNITDCTTYGINAPALYDTNYLDYNNFYNNGTDCNNATKGPHTTSDNPNFTDAANGDFTNSLGANAMPLTTYPGGLTDNFMAQGGIQQEVGGAVETVHGYFE